MKFTLVIIVAFLALQYSSVGKKHKKSFSKFDYLSDDDSILSVEPVPPEVDLTSECTCKCCEDKPAGILDKRPKPKCPNDIVVAVDSSACFRDYHSRTISFLKKLNRRIGRQDSTKYGEDGTRLALMQFSSDIKFAVNLSSFENYTDPSSSKVLVREIDDKISNLEFLGEGAFLNEALNATVEHLRNNPRPIEVLERINQTAREVVILLTNGNSHPSVTMDDVENSINGLRELGAVVLPVSVTRECHFSSTSPGNEGLCPNTVVMKKLAQVGRENGEFFEMKAQDTLPDILSFLKCFPEEKASSAGTCRNCTCSCEFKSLPVGPKGEKGEKGDSIKGEPGDRGRNGTKGEQGEKGEEGKKGDQGDDGEKGETGEKGGKGDVGPEGEPGEDGSKGEKGNDGTKGEPGEAGSKGDEGDGGPKGDRGEKGDVGEKGDSGDEGQKGQKGDTGEIGEKGEKGMGEDGEDGPPGLDGEKGEPGDRGRDGAKGDKGRRGKCGKPGPAGRRGGLGLPGVDGRDGPPGPRGNQGPRGNPGSRGQKGQPGEIGMDGNKGQKGQPGERGPVGLAGNRGTKGIKGEPSTLAGPPGLPGTTGAKGTRGDRGVDGSDGIQGPTGPQGPRGRTGPQGPPGELDIERLRPLIVEIIRDMLPGECEDEDSGEETDESSGEESGEPLPPDVTTTSTTTIQPTTTTRATTTAPFDEICQEDPPFGNCFDGEGVLEEKFYWNSDTQTCEAFTYRRCPGSNVFDTESQCLTRCLGTITTTFPVDDTPGCKDARVGIAFVLDDSASVDEVEFSQLKEFLTEVANQFVAFGPYGLQMAAVSYNGEPIEEFGFNDTTTKASLLSNIQALEHRSYSSGNSQAGRAIEYVGSLFDDLVRPVGTPQPTKVVIVITDGRSEDNVETPSNNLKRKDVLMVAIGADGAEFVELTKIASQPHSRHVHRVPDYEGLADIVDNVVANACTEARGSYVERSTTEPSSTEPTTTLGRLPINNNESP